MKKNNQELKTFIASLFVIMSVVFVIAPSVSFAKNKGEDDRDSKSAWSRFTNLFGIRQDDDSDDNDEDVAVGLTPKISGITAPTVLKIGETGTWMVKASDPQNGSLSYAVDWGEKDSNLKSLRMTESSFVQTSTFEHAYANKGKYTIKFTVENEAGKKATSTVTVNVVDSSLEQGPVISNLAVKSVKPRQATIRWNTDVRATSLVWYSKNSPVDTSETPEVFRPAKVFKHKINLARLEPNTKYYVIVGGTNGKGKMTKSAEISFTTPALDNDSTAPVITGLKGPSTVEVGETETVTVEAYDPRNSSLSYSVNWGDENFFKKAWTALERPIFLQTATFDHVYTKAGTYTATFTVQNEAGKKTSSSMKITVTDTDTKEPVISNIKAIVTGTTTATVSWTTDEPSSSEVLYSTITPVDENASTTASVSSDLLVTEHSLNVSGLTANTLYHFLIESSDAEDNTGTSAELTFTTNS